MKLTITNINVLYNCTGKEIGLKCCAIVGGMDIKSQAKALYSKSSPPHIIVATLGRLAHLLSDLKDFKSILGKIRYLVSISYSLL